MPRKLLPEYESGANGILNLLQELHPKTSSELTRKLDHPDFRGLDRVGRKVQKIVWLKEGHPAILEDVIREVNKRMGPKGARSDVTNSMNNFIERMVHAPGELWEVSGGNYRRL